MSGDMSIQSNLPIKVPGKTTIKNEEVDKIKNDVLNILRNTDKPENKNMEDACSKLMDLWLEDPTDKALNSIMASLNNEIGGTELFDKFKSSYFEPSIKVMSCISGGSKVAEKYDYNVEVNSAANLKQIGLRFSVDQDGDIQLHFAPGLKGIVDGKEVDLNTQAISLDDKTKGVSVVETKTGFQIQIDNTDSASDILELSVPQQVSTDKLASYKKGTRYAVISKHEICYGKSS